MVHLVGETPLLHAARQGQTATAKYLLDCGADPAVPSELGATAVHHAAGIGLLTFCLSYNQSAKFFSYLSQRKRKIDYFFF